MGIDLGLQGVAPFRWNRLFGGASVLDQAAEWLEQEGGDLFCRVQPCGNKRFLAHMHALQVAEFTALGRNAIKIDARTSTVGPGYHRHLCDTFRRMGKDLGLRWKVVDDETGYFSGGKPGDVDEHMMTWLGGLARVILDLHRKHPDIEHHYVNMGGDQFLPGGLLVTPMGPRNETWLERTAANPWMGIDIFPWMNELGPEVLKNWAEALMWNDVRWRKPLQESEEQVMRDICILLATAHEEDPTLKYPWREWLEVLDYCGGNYDRTELEKEAAVAKGPLIGYRRGDVMLSLEPWNIRVPGEFAYESDERSFIMFSETRQIQVTTLSYKTPPGRETISQEAIAVVEKNRNDPPGTEKIANDTEKFHSRAFIFPEPGVGGRHMRMQSVCSCPEELLLCSYYYEPGDSEWAMNAWRSIAYSSTLKRD